MKLCILTHSYPRFEGDWRSNFIESLARAYANRGVDVTVCVPRSSRCTTSGSERDGVKVVRYRYAPCRALHTIGYGHSMRQDLKINLFDLALMPLMITAGTVRLARLIRREKFDLIQVHWVLPSVLIALAGRFLARSRALLFVSFPGSDVTVITKLGWLGRVIAKVTARADYLSCNSADLKDDLVRAGIPGERIDYAVYGVDDAKIHFTEAGRVAVRAALGIPAGAPLLLMIGRFVPKKGFSSAFRALKPIAARVPEVRLVVVGDGPLKDEYRAILHEDGTGPLVTFVGEIATGELKDYYSAADVFLMPSRRHPSDGLNVVVLEAMACGRPVVASRVGGNDLVITDGSNGLLHDEGDCGRLAEHVIRLVGQPDLRAEMGRRAVARVREQFTWDLIARRYLDTYRALAQGRRA